MTKWSFGFSTAKGSLGRAALEASAYAVKRAEMYGTTLVIKEDGKIKELTPRQMKNRLEKLHA